MPKSNEKRLWVWPRAYGQVVNNAQDDVFKAGSRKGSKTKEVINLIRESTQNTIDATDTINGQKAKIEFSYKKIKDSDLVEDKDQYSRYLEDLFEYKKAVENIEDIQNLKKNDLKTPDYILIQDFGTGGIGGDHTSDQKKDNPIQEIHTDWGKSNKGAGSSGGSKGLGRKVQLFASKMNAVFYRNKQCDERIQVSGVSFIEATEYNEKARQGSAFFVKEVTDSENSILKFHTGSEIEMNQEEEDFELRFTKAWGIKDSENDSGLAIVIPFPEDSVKNNFGDITIAGLIENFPVAIIREDLQATIEGEELKYQNFFDKAKSTSAHISGSYLGYKNNHIEYLRFIDDVVTNIGDKNFKSFNLKEGLEKEDVQNIFSVQDIKELKESYERNSSVLLRFNFKLNKNNELVDTFVDVAFGKPSERGRGIDMSYRVGMAISEEKNKLAKLHHGAFLADDEHISGLLSTAEDTGHTKWLISEKDLRKKGYEVENAKDVIEFSQQILGWANEFIFFKNDEDFETSWDDMFMFEKPNVPSETKDKKDDDSEEQGEVIIEQRNVEYFKISRDMSNSGIVITKNPDADSDNKNKYIEVIIRYQTDPILGGVSRMFDLYKDVEYEGENCIVDATSKKNSFSMKISKFEDNFICKVNKFDKNLDLDVRVNMREENEG